MTLAGIVGLLAFNACHATIKVSDDSESHFLSFCRGECGGGLSCVCGVCTQTCEANDVCSDLAEGATCISRLAECGEINSVSPSVCEFGCDSDASCASLGDSYRCVYGACRAGSSSVVDGGGGASGKEAGGGDVSQDASADSGRTDGNSSDASGDSGNASGDSGNANSLSCEEVRKAFDQELRELRACDRDEQCGQVLTGTSCGCTRNLVVRNDADPSELNELRGVKVAAETCVQLGSTCDCPEADGFACFQNVCTWNYVQDGCCLISELTWGKDGGLILPNSHPQHRLTGCNEYSFSQGTASCANGLPGCNGLGISADQVNAAIDALGLPPNVGSVAYGRDTRPVDGVVDIIQIGEVYEVIVGEPCNDTADCHPIPQAVSDLLSLLARLTVQQNASSGCAPQLGCYEPLFVGPCDALIPRYAYDPSRGCYKFDWGGCEPNGNNFETFEACQQACFTDPCAYGLVFEDSPPADCMAVARNSCFSSTTSACACECAANGASLDDCSVTDDTPAIASCTP